MNLPNREWWSAGEMSSYAEIMARVWNGGRLFSVLLELTYRCNRDCFFCYNDLADSLGSAALV